MIEAAAEKRNAVHPPFVSMARWMLLFGLLGAAVGCSTFGPGARETAKKDTGDPLELKFGVARMAERYGALSEARASYLELLKTDPNYVPALHRLGVVALKLEHLDESLDYLHQAADAGTPSSELLGDLGYAQFLKGDLEPARKTLEKALETSPTDKRLMNNLALVVGHQGRIEESLELFRRVGGEAESLSNMGFIMSQSGRLADAKRYFHRAIELDPTLDAAAKGLLDLHRLENAQGPLHEVIAADDAQLNVASMRQ
jgi:Flp pilus assembly protein TadD